MSAGIAITVQARLGTEALEPGPVRDLPRGHRGGRARKRHLARKADSIRCELPYRFHVGPLKRLVVATSAGFNEERTVKSLYGLVKRRDNPIVSRCIHHTVPHQNNITVTRRKNVLALFQEYATAQLAAGESAKGLEQAFAAALEISPSMWSQIKSSRPISDKLARQIESHMKKPGDWLDEERGASGPDAAEERFVELARKAWRGTNGKGKKALVQLLRNWPPTHV
jgi:hypothetical protein